MSRVMVVGGLPNPIGGVTSFIYRLAENNMVDFVVDLYPSDKKMIPSAFKGGYIGLRGFLHFWFISCFSGLLVKNISAVHFNFSKPISLILPFFIPKRNVRFFLMLHHGRLKSPYPRFITRVFLSRFDVVYALSSSQMQFYLRNGCKRVVNTTSYIPSPAPSGGDKVDPEVLSKVESSLGYGVVSGYCKEIYNHHWVVDLYASGKVEGELFVFLYGKFDEEYYSLLKKIAGGNKNVTIFVDKDEGAFNYALAKSMFYLRPNFRDSFGIAVADAVSFGVPVLASDVCGRYPGAYLFKAISYESFVIDFFKFRFSPEELEVSSDEGLGCFKYDKEDCS